jgi:CysZ protein
VANGTPVQFEDISQRGFAGRLQRGLGFLFGGLGQTLTQGDLRLLTMACIAINVVVYSALVYLGYAWLDDVTAWLPSAEGTEGVKHFFLSLLEGVVKVLMFVVWLLVSVWAALAISNVLAGPIFDMMSERVEEKIVGRSLAPKFSVTTMVSMGIREILVQLGLLLIYLPLAITIFVIGLVPLIGTLLAPVLAFSLTALWVGIGFTGQATARHGLSSSQRVRLVFSNKALAVGFGAVGGIPFLSFILLPLLSPALVVGGTRMFLALAAWDRVPSKLTDADKAAIRKDVGQLTS